MKNYLTEADFLPTLSSGRTLTITTDYSRPDTEVPFLNRVVLNKLRDAGRVKVERAPGAYKYKLTPVQ